MTHDPEAERAEFEAWFEDNRLALIRSMDQEELHAFDDMQPAYWFAWKSAWQAARRAPAAPVPRGVVEPIETVKYWRDAYANPQGDEHFMGHGMVVKIFDDYLGMLAAAPQPPEAAQSNSAEFDGIEKAAAPVQLPEPAFYADDRGYEVSAEWLASDDATSDYREVYTIPRYTEQQVREMLAAHGIKVNQ